MKFNNLSRNAFIILEEIFNNKDLMKLIHYAEKNPLDQPDIEDKNIVFMNTLSPIPYTFEVPDHQKCELRVFFSDGVVQERVWLDSIVYFQFIYHNSTCLINIDGENQIRFYEVLNRITNTFEDKSIKTLGKLNFEQRRYRHYYTGHNDYGVYETSAIMGTLGGNIVK